MKKTLYLIAIIIASLTIPYLIISYCMLNFNPVKWGYTARFVHAGFSILLIVFILASNAATNKIKELKND